MTDETTPADRYGAGVDGAVVGLSFPSLRRANIARDKEWNVGTERLSLTFRAAELADVAICLDLLAMELGVDFGAAITAKFNATSEKYGLATTLPYSSEAMGEVPGNFGWALERLLAGDRLRRVDWNRPDCVFHDPCVNGFFMKMKTGFVGAYSPSYCDLTAQDWQIATLTTGGTDD